VPRKIIYTKVSPDGITMDDQTDIKKPPVEKEISDKDIYDAMKDIQGYLDVTPADLKEIYRFAFRHATERIARSVRASDIMTREVLTVKRDTPLHAVAELMAEKTVSGVPVLDENGRVAGIISEKDFLAHIGARDKTHFMSFVAEYLKGKDCAVASLRSQKAEDIMTSPALTVTEDVSAGEIATIFTGKNINRVPVTDIEGNLTGIVSRADIVRASQIKTRS
jgi:CBS domain-containing membrane protein